MAVGGMGAVSAAASAAAPHAPLRVAPARERAHVAAASLVRLGTFFALALYGALHWGALLDPGAGFSAFAMVVASTAAGAVLLAVPRIDRRGARAAALAGIALALLAAAFVTAGAPLRLLVPDSWGDLAAGMGQGLQSMPGVSVPYRGVDEWVRAAIMIGGTLLIGLAALLAFWPGRRAEDGRTAELGFPMAAAVALGVLYGVPIVEHGPRRPFLDGAVFCLLVAAFLWLERLRSDQLGVAAAAVGLSILAGALVAPRLDGTRPWFDYEHFAETLEPTVNEQFSWDHSYLPLQWPRDGRELLRVQAQSGTYWKAITLDEFDGLRWRFSGSFPAVEQDTQLPHRHSDWYQTIRVVDRGLKSRQFIGAGTTLTILPPAPRSPVLEAPGMYVTGGSPLTRGDSYRARVYSPTPTELELRSAGTDYPDFSQDYLDLELPRSVGGPQPTDPYTHQPLSGVVTERFDPFLQNSGGAPPLAQYPDGTAVRDVGAKNLLDSAYGPAYKLVRQLRSQATTAYDFVIAVKNRVEQGATYSESPPPHRIPLVSFLFDDRVGYCQQFSGAMALLLRMGGVPARVASGFTTGTLDRKRNEYVVRDLDAHSWVEAYFPHLGWIRFDPTPSSAPARAQSAAGSSGSAAGAAGAPNLPGDHPGDVGKGAGRADQAGGLPAWAIVAGALLLVAVATALVVLVRRGRLPGQPLAPELAELQRALHRSGRTPSPDVTLARLEEVLGGTDAAAGYVRALRDRRYGLGEDAPSAAQRVALRRELGAGLGFNGKLRALWALPPRPGEWRWLLRWP